MAGAGNVNEVATDTIRFSGYLLHSRPVALVFQFGSFTAGFNSGLKGT